MSKKIFCLGLLSLALVACGSGNDDNEVDYNGYNTGYYGGPGLATCPGQVANDWNRLIASRCNNVQSIVGPRAKACAWGAKEFQSRYPGINCNIAIAKLQWCPGDNWRAQPTFNINDGVIQSIYTKFGGAAGPTWPTDGGYNGGYNGGPGYPGGHY